MQRDDIDVWLESLNSADDVAEECYTSMRNSWPGTKPKWMRNPWNQLPTDLRGLLVKIAERAALAQKQR